MGILSALAITVGSIVSVPVPTWVVTDAGAELTAEYAVQIGTLALEYLPAVSGYTVTAYSWSTDGGTQSCSVTYTDDMTDDAKFDAVAGGEGLAPGGETVVTSTCTPSSAAGISSLLVALSAADANRVVCSYGSNGTMRCRSERRKTGTASEWLADYVSGAVVRTLGRLEP